MEKITVKKLNGRHVEKVLLRSVTLSICIVQVEIDGVSYHVVDEKGQIVRFNGAPPTHHNPRKKTTHKTGPGEKPPPPG
ncbi:MAG TPA: hypothetical protein DIW42_04055, partial [Alcanivorax sp.]|nr:hypothetical protein [Alcanivorax sp.]